MVDDGHERTDERAENAVTGNQELFLSRTMHGWTFLTGSPGTPLSLLGFA